MTFKETLAAFLIEYIQGEDPIYLLRKYGFDSYLAYDENENGFIPEATNEGNNVYNQLLSLTPKDLAKAVIDQKKNPEKFPWSVKKNKKIE